MMSRKWRRGLPVLGALVLSACGGGASYTNEKPSNTDHACAIVNERPHWGEALLRTQAKYGAPPAVQLAIIKQESSFRKDARPPEKTGWFESGYISSAYGFSQALDGTWEWYQDSTGNHGADRDDFADSSDFIGWYMKRTRNVNGLSMNDAYSQYIAYHQGHTGYKRGNWRNKSWLKQTAAKVSRQSAIYERQLRNCSAGHNLVIAYAPDRAPLPGMSPRHYSAFDVAMMSK